MRQRVEVAAQIGFQVVLNKILPALDSAPDPLRGEDAPGDVQELLPVRDREALPVLLEQNGQGRFVQVFHS
ncbi:hypothetical protein [Pseudomonas phage vB_Pae_HLL23]